MAGRGSQRRIVDRRAKGILIVLRSRLKLTQTDEFASVLELVTNKERLDHLFDVALECATIDEFRAALS